LAAPTPDVVDVRVRQQDRLHLDVQVAHRAEQEVHLVTRIDEDGLTRPLAPGNEAVLVERRNCPDLENHGEVF
jgi:hypothetical protein